MPEPPPAIVLVGVNHASASLAVREALSLSAGQLEDLYDRLARTEGVVGAVVLGTCNRVEIYATVTTSADTAMTQLESLLSVVTTYPVEPLREVSYGATGLDALRHLYRVAAGLDSQMVGETEILGQVKASYRQAEERKLLNKPLHRVFQKTFQAAKWARTHTGICEGQVSIGNVAVELAQRIFGDLAPSKTLVIGSGEVGRDVAKAFASRGVRAMAIAGRTEDRARALAEETGGRIVPFAEWPQTLPDWDIVICATSAQHVLIGKDAVAAAIRRRPARPLFLIDLAVPRDIEAGSGDLQNVYLYNFADLAAIANENLRHRQAAVEACHHALDERARSLWHTIGPAREAPRPAAAARPLPGSIGSYN
ncbi:MAG: glutamyl-tRNA reductase [Opitutales bacterium]|nr:glutamyl-tRNA reductase [Opitutales bacterium]